MPQVDFFLFSIQAYLFFIFFTIIYCFLTLKSLPSIFKIFEVRKFLMKNFENKVSVFNFTLFFNLIFIYIEKLIVKFSSILLFPVLIELFKYFTNLDCKLLLNIEILYNFLLLNEKVKNNKIKLIAKSF